MPLIDVINEKYECENRIEFPNVGGAILLSFNDDTSIANGEKADKIIFELDMEVIQKFVLDLY